MYLEGQRVSEQLRALSYRFEAPVVTAVQTNTEGMDTGDIGMKNISQSRAIAHTADFIMAIYNDGGTIRGKIIKNRLGSLPAESGIEFHRDDKTLFMEDALAECGGGNPDGDGDGDDSGGASEEPSIEDIIDSGMCSFLGNDRKRNR